MTGVGHWSPQPDGWRFAIDGTSFNTYLGKATFHGETTTDGSFFSTATAANGDQLNIVITPSGELFFSGGTGRFADASGSLVNTSVDEILPDGTFIVKFVQIGTIRF